MRHEDKIEKLIGVSIVLAMITLAVVIGCLAIRIIS